MYYTKGIVGIPVEPSGAGCVWKLCATKLTRAVINIEPEKPQVPTGDCIDVADDTGPLETTPNGPALIPVPASTRVSAITISAAAVPSTNK